MAVFKAQAADGFRDAREVRAIHGQIHILGQASGQGVTGWDMEQDR
jgi:hypothetical protein